VSAIFGISGLAGQPVGADLRAMQATLAQRGPDGSATWELGHIGVGHQKLATTPESLDERLPLIDVDGDRRWVVTADARIDNRHELVASLGLEAGLERTLSDAALILASYKRWGEDTPARLLGDFAFAIWDHAKQTLFCARDAVGIRPFYYSYCPERFFAFASEIQGVLACPSVPRRINDTKVADHLLQSFDDSQSTFYQDIHRLRAAHSLTLDRHGMRMRRYWSLDAVPDIRLGSDEEYAEAFREIFVEAVRCRTRSAFPVGSTLSGGLDSSSIACAANRLLSTTLKPLRTFSAIFPSLSGRELQRIDERSYVDVVLKSGDFDQTYVYADQGSPLADWPQVSRHLGDACLAPNLYIHWGIYKAASAKGVRVLLDGLDGDTTVSHGLDYLTDLARAGRIVRFMTEARALSRVNSIAYPLRSVVWRLGVRPLVPDYAARSWRAMHAPRPEGEDADVISRQLLEKVRSKTRDRTTSDDVPLGRDAKASHRRALSSPLIPYAMEFADAASSSFGLEVRYPFFDRRLMEFCLAIPAKQKLRNGWTRSVMRRAIAGIVPAEVQWRTGKADLSPNFSRGLFERDLHTIRDVVSSRLEGLRDYINVRRTQAIFERWASQPASHNRDGLTLFAVTTLALWLERATIDGAR
jgi:asparagine synthase (glutamine-hydrolysing)